MSRMRAAGSEALQGLMNIIKNELSGYVPRSEMSQYVKDADLKEIAEGTIADMFKDSGLPANGTMAEGSTSTANELIGSVTAYAGTVAPDGYLICDGSEHQISEYPELVTHFEEQFGSKNHFGGDGVTTFAVPNYTGSNLPIGFIYIVKACGSTTNGATQGGTNNDNTGESGSSGSDDGSEPPSSTSEESSSNQMNESGGEEVEDGGSEDVAEVESICQTITFSELPEPNQDILNYEYTITDGFTTNDWFVDGPGIVMEPGTTIIVIKDSTGYKYHDIGIVDDCVSEGTVEEAEADQSESAVYYDTSTTIDPDQTPISADWLPVGGYVSRGRKYNMYGIDITDVDGCADPVEGTLIYNINTHRAEYGLNWLVWNQHAQLISEIRVREAQQTFGHIRPDGSSIYTCESEVGRNNLNTDNKLLAEELKITDAMVGESLNDATLIDDGRFGEALHSFSALSAERACEDAFFSWIENQANRQVLLQDFTSNDSTARGYIGAAIVYDESNNTYVVQCTIYALADPPKEWSPGSGIDYSALGFTLEDIPVEYPDWIEHDPDMDLESYGPTDHDINSLTHWLIDHGVEENSDIMYQIKAHYFSTLSMDEYLKFLFSNTEVFHYKGIMPGEWSDITEMDEASISSMKEVLVTGVADKLAYQHLSENNHSDTACDVCGKNHDEKRDIPAATAIVNKFFQDTYQFDISAY